MGFGTHITIRDTNGDDARQAWTDAAEAGEGTLVTFRVVDNHYTRGFLYIDGRALTHIVYDAMRGGADPEIAFCDGENPSGLGMVHALSPYTTGQWGLPFDRDQDWSANDIITDAGLTVTLLDETTAEDGSLLYLQVALLTAEARAQWMSQLDEQD